MKVLFLAQTGELGPSSRYRVYQLLPALQRLGIEPTVVALRQPRTWRRADEHDVVMVQKRLSAGRNHVG